MRMQNLLALLAFMPAAMAQTTALPAPWFGPGGGTYTHNLTVAINESVPNMAMFYTTDGSTPSATNGKRYAGAVTVTANVTIKAIAVDLNSPPSYSNSQVSTANYVVDLPYEAPLPQGEWAWESGGGNPTEPTGGCGDVTGMVPVYGRLGVPAAGNVPGSRRGTAQWTDKNGNLWLFGGTTFSGSNGCSLGNDMWMFNTSTKEWTWMSGNNTFPNGIQPGVYGAPGQFAPANAPGGRETAMSWTDKSGNLWLFGGTGYDTTGTWGFLNDMWEFNPSTRQWAWMGGSNVVNQRGAYGYIHEARTGNTPGGRAASAAWTDRNGNFWLFGGYAFDGTGTFGLINDLWEFNPSSLQWAWMTGSHVTNHYGVYGTLHEPRPTNTPGARESPAAWVDGQGNFWLFGGDGEGAPTTQGILNDLWEFNPNNLNWTWAAGNQWVGTHLSFGTYIVGDGSVSVYDKLGTPDPGNIPGSRTGASSWTDAHGNLWLFGGIGYDSLGNELFLNDLWEFDRSRWLWAWMGGSVTGTGTGDNGTFRVASLQTMPGPRHWASSWTDKNGNFWLFGGETETVYFGDLFEYTAP